MVKAICKKKAFPKIVVWLIKVPITSTSFTALVIVCTCPEYILLFLEPSSLLFVLWKRGKQAMVWSKTGRWRRMGSIPGRRHKLLYVAHFKEKSPIQSSLWRQPSIEPILLHCSVLYQIMKIWFYQTSWWRLNYRCKRFIKLTFRALVLRQCEWRSDEELTLERCTFKIFRGGNSTFINSFDKTKFLFHSPTYPVPQFL